MYMKKALEKEVILQRDTLNAKQNFLSNTGVPLLMAR